MAAKNRAAIQSALNNSDPIIIARPGLYYIDQSLIIGDNVDIRAPAGAVIRAVPGMNAAVLTNKVQNGAGNSDIRIDGVIFDGDRANQTAAFSTVDLVQCQRFSFTRCEANNALRTSAYPNGYLGEGFRFTRCSEGSVAQCAARGNIYDGFKTRQSRDISFNQILAVENGRAGIQIAYENPTHGISLEDERNLQSERITVNGVIVYHSTGNPSRVAPTTSGVYIHSASRCTISNINIFGVRQGIGLFDYSQDNVFVGGVLRTRWVDRAVVDIESGAQANRNKFSAINIRPISGTNGKYVRVFDGSSFNSFRDIYAAAGQGAGTWTIDIDGAGALRNQFSDGLVANYNLKDFGTATNFSNWVTY